MLFKNDPFKHGYYEVNGYRTFSKLEAIEIQNKTGHWPHWRFNDEVFAQQNWLQEPKIDLYELYKTRARQIRETYDYVVLFYSGGSDSVNILTAWIDADLKIDEIATVWNLEGSKDRADYMNAEVDRVVLPSVKRLQDKGLDFKFRLIDITEHTESFIKTVGEDYNYYVNNHYSPNNIIKSQFRERIKDYSELIDQGKSVCFVWGSEKPQIFPDGDKHYLQFFDIMDNCVTPYAQQRVAQGWYDELFYWTPDLPEMIVKQAHTLLKFAETCDMQEFYQSKPNRYGYNRKIKQYITSAAAKIILYPKWDPTTFNNGKPTNVVFSERDSWFWNGNTDGRSVLDPLNKRYFATLGSAWINDGCNPRSGIKGHCSPKYYLN
jgi:hypothetical protein